MATEHSFSDTALAQLDSMWPLDMSMAVIRRRLHLLTGIDFSAREITEAATRHVAKPKPVVSEVVASALTERSFSAPRPALVQDKVRIVAPGTFPARGFTMIGARRNG